ncbi:MAG TPA: DUF2752 domain-containing protein [Bacteroidales bacterium]|nr:DUF2752 domain-containing protein [Bacteroidales bacterium]
MIEWWKNHMIPCPVHHLTGYECPGCGMQRAIIELLKGNLWESILYYPALIPLIIMFIVLILHLKFDIKNGAKILKFVFILNAIIVSLSYILKISQH